MLVYGVGREREREREREILVQSMHACTDAHVFRILKTFIPEGTSPL